MRRAPRFVAATALALGAGWGITHVPEWLADVEMFTIREVRVEGIEFLGRDELIRTARFGPDANIWDDMDPVVSAVEKHPLVREARIQRRPPATVVIEVVEEPPVAFVASPTLEPVDARGRVLPIDPADQQLDLPILRVREDIRDAETGQPSVETRILAAEAAHISGLDPELRARVSELWLEGDGSLGMALGEPRIDLRFRRPLAVGVLDRGLRTLEDALRQGGDSVPVHLDLRIPDQVVVRLDRPSTRNTP